MNRRHFLEVSTLAAGGLGLKAFPASLRAAESMARALPVTQVRFDLNRIHKWDDSNGYTWDPFWADDDQLYAFNCDGRGFGKQSRNLAFNVFAGAEFESLAGRQVNSMDEYGKSNEKRADNATWKVCGQECIDGVFYAFVSRNVYGHESHDPLLRQTALNSSLIMSKDRGRRWTRTAEENYAQPMWSGAAFAAPFFVHYGKDGGRIAVDGSDQYVYAVSTNGFWCDGDLLVLGRVRRDRIADLNARDWQYWQGSDSSSPANWTMSVYEGRPILARPAKCGQTPITFVPALGIYLLISWYNPEILPKWYNPTEMRYDIHAAPHPWGPWSEIGSLSDTFLAPGSNMYGPSICAKYQDSGPEGVTVKMFTSGCQFEDVPSSIYKAWSMPIVLETKPVCPSTYYPVENAGFEKTGNWQVLGADPGRENLAWQTSRAGDKLTVHFEGSGFEILARKNSNYGSIEIVVDGQTQGTIHLATKNLPELSGVRVFRSLDMKRGKHDLEIVSQSADSVNVQGIRIFR